MTNRQAHLPCIEAGKNISEIACRDSKVYGITGFNRSFFAHIRVSTEIINNLRNKTSPVYGIRTGQLCSFCLKLLYKNIVFKYLLYTGLGIIKVTLYRNDLNIIALLRHHLQLLHCTDAVLRVKHLYLCLRYVCETRKRGFSCIA